MTFVATVDTEAEERKRANIYQAAYDGTKTAIETEIENEKEKTRSGENGFWSKIFFAIAEFIDNLFNTNFFTGMLAKMNGTPIPETPEIEKASDLVAKAVSDKMNDKTFTYNTRQEFEAGISEAIKANLTANKDALSSFGEEQIARLASEGAAETGKTFAGFFKEDGTAILKSGKLSPADAAAKSKLTESFGQMLSDLTPEQNGRLASLLGKKDLTIADLDGLTSVLTPTMAGLELSKDSLKEQGGAALTSISEKLRARLIENKDFINASGQMTVTDNALRYLADEITVKFAESSLGMTNIAETAPKEFLADREGRTQGLIQDMAKRVVAEKMQEEIKVGSAVGVLAVKYNDSWDKYEIAARNLPERLGGIPEAPIAVMNKYYENDGKGKEAGNYKRNGKKDENGELAAAQQELYDYAVRHDTSLDDKQRKVVSDAVGKVVVDVISDPENRALTSKQLAPLLQSAIKEKLKGSIEGKDELFGKIADGLADAVLQNKEGTFTDLNNVNGAINRSRARAVNHLNGGKIEGPVTGGLDLDEPLLQAGSRIQNNRESGR